MENFTVESGLYGRDILFSGPCLNEKSGKSSRDNTSKQESNIREQEEEAESLDALGRICPQKDHKISGPSNTRVAQWGSVIIIFSDEL